MSVETDVIRQRLNACTFVKDDHIICTNSEMHLTISGRCKSANYWYYQMQNGHEVPDNYKLQRVCDEFQCIKHWDKVWINKKRSREPEDDHDEKPKRVKITEIPNDAREAIMARITARCIEGEPTVPVAGKCSLWQGAVDKDGYGMVSVSKHVRRAHKIMYELYTNSIVPDNRMIRHLCGRRNCVAEAHLAIGSAVDNAHDRKIAGTDLLGEMHPRATISNETALQIFRQSDLSVIECMKAFNCSRVTVESIRSGKSWNHITGLAKFPIKPVKRRDLTVTDAVPAQKYIHDRISKHADDDGEEHWIWKGMPNSGGYCYSAFRSRNLGAHIFSYRVFNDCQPIPAGKFVRHKCKYKNCVNPSHLELGTHQQNMQDKVRDGTSSRGDQSKRAKITNEMARNIYASKGDGTQKQRAERYGVTVHIVAHIDRGTSWKHVTQADASALTP